MTVVMNHLKHNSQHKKEDDFRTRLNTVRRKSIEGAQHMLEGPGALKRGTKEVNIDPDTNSFYGNGDNAFAIRKAAIEKINAGHRHAGSAPVESPVGSRSGQTSGPYTLAGRAAVARGVSGTSMPRASGGLERVNETDEAGSPMGNAVTQSNVEKSTSSWQRAAELPDKRHQTDNPAAPKDPKKASNPRSTESKKAKVLFHLLPTPSNLRNSALKPPISQADPKQQNLPLGQLAIMDGAPKGGATDDPVPPPPPPAKKEKKGFFAACFGGK